MGAGLEYPPLLMSLHGPVYNHSTLRQFNSELMQSFTVVSVLLKVTEYLYFNKTGLCISMFILGLQE